MASRWFTGETRMNRHLLVAGGLLCGALTLGAWLTS